MIADLKSIPINPDPIRLNLGSGETMIEGYQPLDRALGDEVYPLDYPDGSVSEIRASHVLEHFSHRDIADVVADWARALQPGGLLKIAVPDFEKIAQRYLSGANIPTEAFVMGGHVDENDRHGALFDFSQLCDILKAAGLIGISRWRSEIQDCASLPISLNLQAFKPPAVWPKTSAVMSAPRLTFTDNAFCLPMLQRLGIEPRKVTGAYWGQCMTRGLEIALEEDNPEWLLTVDYDSIYTSQDVLSLLLLAQHQSDRIDALAPLQMRRGKAQPLFTMRADDGQNRTEIPREVFDVEFVKVSTAHFGLTVLKASALKELPRPWFQSEPDQDGRWGEDRVDEDVNFWRRWERAGNSIYIASRIPIGHAELMIQWPNMDLETIYAPPSEFWADGKPEHVWR